MLRLVPVRQNVVFAEDAFLQLGLRTATVALALSGFPMFFLLA